jgi:excisionase family DNA binding protein
MASDLAGDRLRLGSTSQRAEAHIGVAPLLDATGAAALLNVPASWVLAEARADRIPHVRLGRYVRFDAAELQIWWETRSRGPWRSRRAAATITRAGVTSATTADSDF